MFNNKRIKELERSVRALKHMVDMQGDELYGCKHSLRGREIGFIDKMDMLEDHLDVSFVVTPLYSSCIKNKKEKK
tara:strand:- start:695 stop:919 length:225 start_codon:yes stop_codon:yes gene_type:complete